VCSERDKKGNELGQLQTKLQRALQKLEEPKAKAEVFEAANTAVITIYVHVTLDSPPPSIGF